MSNIISHSEAKQARALTKLSQGKVASDLGINRTYLSLFESGKYVFDDSILLDLRDYYEELGFDIGQDSTDLDGSLEQGHCGSEMSQETIVRDRNNFPSSGKKAASEEQLSVHTTNTHRIKEICSEKVKRGLFGGVNRENLNKKLDEVVWLLAKNELITLQMRGNGDSALIADTDGDETLYVGHYLANRLLDPKKGTESDSWDW